METIENNNIEPVTISDVLGLASWDRPRTDQELHDFISSREALLGIR
jgi:hypothetical protein